MNGVPSTSKFSRIPAWSTLALLLAIASALAVTLDLLWATDTRGNDDAGILWTYARNLADGHGLVYKPGEYVEGYSSFLDVIVLGAGLWTAKAVGPLIGVAFNPKIIYWISLFVNLAAWIAIVVIVFRFVKEELDDRAAAFVALLLGINPAMAYWVCSGMDTIVGTLSQALVWVWLVRLDRRTGTGQERGAYVALSIAMVFSLLVRAEGFLWPLLALAWLVWRGRYLQAVRAGTVFAAACVCFIGWRMWYYGYPLPNTYYAKVAGTLAERMHSAWYLQSRQVIFDTGLLIAILGFGANIVQRLVLFANVSRKFMPSDFEIVASLAWIAYFFYVGGDVYYERQILILFPLGFVAAARAVNSSLTSAGSVAMAVLVALSIVMYPLWGYYRPLTAKYRGDGLEKVGKFLKENYPGTTVALNLAGKISYYSELPCIDMLGLCDEYVGHSIQDRPFIVGHTKRGFGYAIQRKPEVVAVCPQVFTGDSWDLIIDDDYTIGDMKSIGYVPVLACNVEDWFPMRKYESVALADLAPEKIKEIVARHKFDLLIFYNPNPTGQLPLQKSGNQ